MSLNKEAILRLNPRIVKLKTPACETQQQIGIIRYNPTHDNPGVTIYIRDIDVDSESKKLSFIHSHNFISVLVDNKNDESVDDKNVFIIENGNHDITAKKRLDIGVNFDNKGNVVNFNLLGKSMAMFINDEENEIRFRADYNPDPNDPTKGVRNEKYIVWDSESKLIQYDISDLPEAVPDEVDLGATLEMFVFGKRPITGQPVDADILASPATLVVPWNETHP